MAIVIQTASASWSGTSGNCADGLGGTPVPDEIGRGASSVKTVPSIKENPGHSFSMPAINPSASASFTAGDPTDLRTGLAFVSYVAAAYPVTVAVVGSVTDNGVTYGEVSRQHSAYLATDAPGVTFDQCNWSVSGGAFKTYNHDDGSYGTPKSGWVVPLSSYDLTQTNGVVFHWKKQGEETVSCSARASYNWQPFGTVAATKNVSVEKPFSFLDGTCSGVSTIVNFGLESWGNPDVTATDGSMAAIAYSFWVRPCPHFSGGKAYNAQLVNANWGAWPNPIWVTTNDAYYLDTSYPYNERAPATTGTVPTPTWERDAPAYVSRIPVTWSITTAFEIHMMYAAADSAEADTPLRILYWNWNGQGGDSTNGNTIPGTPSKGVSGETTLHPEWNDVLSLR